MSQDDLLLDFYFDGYKGQDLTKIVQRKRSEYGESPIIKGQAVHRMHQESCDLLDLKYTDKIKTGLVHLNVQGIMGGNRYF